MVVVIVVVLGVVAVVVVVVLVVELVLVGTGGYSLIYRRARGKRHEIRQARAHRSGGRSHRNGPRQPTETSKGEAVHHTHVAVLRICDAIRPNCPPVAARGLASAGARTTD